MTIDAGTDRFVRTWLQDGPDRLPDPVLREVLERVPTIRQRQRAWWRPWLSLGRGAVGFASAAAVAVALLTIMVLNLATLPSVGPRPTASPAQPTPVGSPTPGPVPTTTGLVETLGLTYPETVFVGNPMVVEVNVGNRGDAASEPIELRFTDLSANATFRTCTPNCGGTVLAGDIRAAFVAGVPARGTATFAVELVATDAGDVTWSLYVYEGESREILRKTARTQIAPAGAASPSPGQTVTPTIAPPPANDAPPGDLITTLPFTDSTNVTLAQIHAMEPSTPCGGGSKSVWYSYTAPAAATVTANTFGSDYDTILDIWRGTLTTDYLNPGFETLQMLACNDDAGSPQSAVVFATEAGQSYVIRVVAKEGIGGNLTFNLLPS